mmetsp:Transcript_11006/g.16639  ORF Transcript_11006/g.16639 Transcript_11006/m.16639 type:complete len:2238 (+) Transcript_11006:237-6950(+)
MNNFRSITMRISLLSLLIPTLVVTAATLRSGTSASAHFGSRDHHNGVSSSRPGNKQSLAFSNESEETKEVTDALPSEPKSARNNNYNPFWLHKNDLNFTNRFLAIPGLWTQIGQDLDGKAAYDQFGSAVAISRDKSTLAVGAPRNGGKDSVVFDVGHVMVYKYNTIAKMWEQKGDFTGDEAGDKFGISVALSEDGNTLAAGGLHHNSGRGHVKCFKSISNGSEWNEVADLDGIDLKKKGEFGRSVHLSDDGNILAVGAPLADTENGEDSGHVAIYEYKANKFEQKGNPLNGASADDSFGFSIDMAGDGLTIGIGMYKRYATSGLGTGQVAIYKFASGKWTEKGQVIQGSRSDLDQFGMGISMSKDGGVIAIGSPRTDVEEVGSNSGEVQVYNFVEVDDTWIPKGQPISGESAEDASGVSIGMSDDGNIIVIGSLMNAGGNGRFSGHTRAFIFFQGKWEMLGSDLDGEFAGDLSGRSISLSGDGEWVAVGGPLNDGSAINAGHVRVFQIKAEISTPPTGTPTNTEAPTVSFSPTKPPTISPTSSPSLSPSISSPPYNEPSSVPSVSIAPSSSPTMSPTTSAVPSSDPTESPSVSAVPTIAPTSKPSSFPAAIPSSSPSLSLMPSISRSGRFYPKGKAFSLESLVATNVSEESQAFPTILENSSITSVSIGKDGNHIAIGFPSKRCSSDTNQAEDNIFDLNSNNRNDSVARNYADCGEVKLYSFHCGLWQELGGTIEENNPGSSFGISVALTRNSNSVIIGSTLGASIYKFVGSDWVRVGNAIKGESADYSFGRSVSIADNGEIVVIGGPGNGSVSSDASGYAKVYILGTNNEWTQVGEQLNGENYLNFFGWASSISSDGKTIALSAFANSEVGRMAGHARVFKINAKSWDEYDSNTEWQQFGSDINGRAAGDRFGNSIDLSADGNIIAVGGPGNESQGQSGTVQVFVNTNGEWASFGQELSAGLNERFGKSVSLSDTGETLAVGSIQGNVVERVRVYRYIPTEGNWIKLGDQIIEGFTTVNLSGNGKVLIASGKSLVQVFEYKNNPPVGYPTMSPSCGPSSPPNIVPSSKPSEVSPVPSSISSLTGAPSSHKQLDFWAQVGKDIIGTTQDDSSGSSVALSKDGTCVAIGAPFNDQNGSSAGEVVVLRLSSERKWVHIGNTLRGENESTRFGTSVDISNNCDTLAVGGILNSNESGVRSGHARLYRLKVNQWSQIGLDIDGSKRGDQLGRSVSLSQDGNIVAVTSPMFDAQDGSKVNSGIVRIFRYSEGLNSLQLMGSEIEGKNAGDYFGHSVSLSSTGMTVAVGSFGLDSSAGNNSGSVQIFSFAEGAWVEQGSQIDGQNAGDQAGFSVSLSGDSSTVVIGSPFHDSLEGVLQFDVGMVQVFRFFNETWQQVGQDITCAMRNGFCGYSTSISSDGNIIAFGSLLNNAPVFDEDHAFVYKFVESEWQKIGVNSFSGSNSSDFFGTDVSLSENGQRLAVGSPGAGENAGKVQVFEHLDIMYPSSTPSISPSSKPSDSVRPSVVPTPQTSQPSDSPLTSPSISSPFPTFNETLPVVHSHEPSYTPTTASPSYIPSGREINTSSPKPTILPASSSVPTSQPSTKTTIVITTKPSLRPGLEHSSKQPSTQSSVPSSYPTSKATILITSEPSLEHSSKPTETSQPSGKATDASSEPSLSPSLEISSKPTETSQPSAKATDASLEPSLTPSLEISNNFTMAPTIISSSLSPRPTSASGTSPTLSPTGTVAPTTDISITSVPTIRGSLSPTTRYSRTIIPTISSGNPSSEASNSEYPSISPTMQLTKSQGPIVAPAWETIGIIEGVAAQDYFGWSVAMSGDARTIAIGSTFNDSNGPNAGSVQTFSLSSNGYDQLGEPMYGLEGDRLGTSVALSQDGISLIVGARRSDGVYGADSGEARVYQRNGNSWVQIGSSIEGLSKGDQAGFTVDMSDSGETVAIGSALNDNVNGENSGSVRVYEYVNAEWLQLGRTLIGDSSNDGFGSSTALSGDGRTIVVGSPTSDNAQGVGYYNGQVKVFNLAEDDAGRDWEQVGDDINGSGQYDQFGISIDISEDGKIVGIGKFVGENNGVSFYVIENGQWTMLGKEIEFGFTVSLCGDGLTAAVGDFKQELDSGEVRIYNYADGSWRQTGDSLLGERKDQFGRSIAISGNGEYVASGAPGHNGVKGASAGKTEVFYYGLVRSGAGLRNGGGESIKVGSWVQSSSSASKSPSLVMGLSVAATLLLRFV